MKIFLFILFEVSVISAQRELNSGIVEPKRNPFIEGFDDEIYSNPTSRQSFQRPPIAPPGIIIYNVN
jgi:hypothetical protein